LKGIFFILFCKQIKVADKKKKPYSYFVVHRSKVKSVCPETSETTGSVWPAREVAGSMVLAAELKFHAKIVPSCGIESQKNQQGYKM
jgi:hypothetical protein